MRRLEVENLRIAKPYRNLPLKIEPMDLLDYCSLDHVSAWKCIGTGENAVVKLPICETPTFACNEWRQREENFISPLIK